MTEADRERFPPVPVELKDGSAAVVRPLLPSDGEKLGVFYKSVPRCDRRFYSPFATTRPLAREHAAEADTPFKVVLLLETHDGGIGGHAWYSWKDENAERSGFGICIAPDYQNRGAGRALMTRLEEIAREIGPPVMGLTVQKANGRGLTLYQSMGFRPVREQVTGPNHPDGFPPEPEYYMERQVR